MQLIFIYCKSIKSKDLLAKYLHIDISVLYDFPQGKFG